MHRSQDSVESVLEKQSDLVRQALRSGARAIDERDSDRVKAQARRALKQQPGDPFAQQLMAFGYYLDEEFDLAYEIFDALCGRHDDELALRVNAGICATRGGRDREAARHLQHAVSLDPGHRRAFAHLALVHLRSGDDELARAALDEAGLAVLAHAVGSVEPVPLMGRIVSELHALPQGGETEVATDPTRAFVEVSVLATEAEPAAAAGDVAPEAAAEESAADVPVDGAELVFEAEPAASGEHELPAQLMVSGEIIAEPSRNERRAVREARVVLSGDIVQEGDEQIGKARRGDSGLLLLHTHPHTELQVVEIEAKPAAPPEAPPAPPPEVVAEAVAEAVVEIAAEDIQEVDEVEAAQQVAQPDEGPAGDTPSDDEMGDPGRALEEAFAEIEAKAAALDAEEEAGRAARDAEPPPTRTGPRSAPVVPDPSSQPPRPVSREDLASYRLSLPLMPGMVTGPQLEVRGGRAYLRFGAWCSEAEQRWSAVVREDRALAQQGRLHAEIVSRRRKGEAVEPFVLPDGPMLRTRGDGVVVLDAPAGCHVELVRLDEHEVLYAQESAVAAFTGGLHWENGSLPGDGPSPPMLRLAGLGAVLILSRELHAVPVRDHAPVVVRRSALVGWVGDVVVAPHLFSPTRSLYCEGEGTVLLEAVIERRG